MTRKRRSFSTEFKQEAASLVLDQGYSLAAASRSLDVGETALRRWAQQLEKERGGITPTTKALTPEQQRIQELEARCQRLEQEKDILTAETECNTYLFRYGVAPCHTSNSVLKNAPLSSLAAPRAWA